MKIPSTQRFKKLKPRFLGETKLVVYAIGAGLLTGLVVTFLIFGGMLLAFRLLVIEVKTQECEAPPPPYFTCEDAK